MQALLVAERCAALAGYETDFVMILTIAYTGMRWSEAVGLKPAPAASFIASQTGGSCRRRGDVASPGATGQRLRAQVGDGPVLPHHPALVAAGVIAAASCRIAVRSGSENNQPGSGKATYLGARIRAPLSQPTSPSSPMIAAGAAERASR